MRGMPFHREDYCRKITQAYDALCKQGFGYLDVHWYADSDANTTGLTIDSLRRQTSDHLLKLLGEAGTGKSTSLKQMEYLMAKELAGKSRGMIPVLIELGHLSDEDRPVLSRAARQLNIGESRLSVLLTGGNICLLLDGFNEILDLMLKKKIAKELELMKCHPLTLYFDPAGTHTSGFRVGDWQLQSAEPSSGKLVTRVVGYDCESDCLILRADASDGS